MARRVTEAEIRRAAKTAGIPYRLFYAVVGQESGGRSGAISPAGARGAAQLMPGTARGLESRYGIDTSTPYGNLLGGAYYLREQKDRFKTWRKALAAYNAGPGAVQKYGGVPPYEETQNYVRNILGKAGVLTGSKARSVVGGGSEVPSSPAAPSLPRPDPLEAVLSQGLQDLIEGDYSPQRQLGSLLEAQRAAKAAPLQAGVTAVVNAPQRAAPEIKVQGKLTPRVKQAISLVQEAMGTPYVWGGESPGGFDCSGLLQYAWGKAGVQIPRVSQDQWRAGQAVRRAQLRPGDAVFFRGYTKSATNPGHVGMYIGNGKFIEAPKKGTVVRISNLSSRKDYVGARRFA